MIRDEKMFYVSNRELYNEYVKWYKEIENFKVIEAARKEEIGEDEYEELDEPNIPPFIVQSMMRIANRLLYKPCFIGYTFHDEMISDALYDCVRHSRKFKATYKTKDGDVKEGNPFSYITTICFNAFLRRIDKEKTQKYIKAKIVAQSADHEFLDQQNDDDSTYVNQYVDFLREAGYSEDTVPMSIKRTKKYKESQPAGPLDKFENV